MSDLKPCPFCGGEARLISSDPECRGYLISYRVECANCGDWEVNPAKAIAAWNERALLAEQEPVAWVEVEQTAHGKLRRSGHYPIAATLAPGKYDAYLAPQPSRELEALEVLTRAVKYARLVWGVHLPQWVLDADAILGGEDGTA